MNPFKLEDGDGVRMSGKSFHGEIEVPKGRLVPYGGFEHYVFRPDPAPVPIERDAKTKALDDKIMRKGWKDDVTQRYRQMRKP